MRIDFSKCKDDDEWWRMYGEYLKSKEWRVKRAKRLKIDKYICQTCQESDISKMEVHHKNYDRVGHENIKEDLITLCNACHNAVTKSIRWRRWRHKREDKKQQQKKRTNDDEPLFDPVIRGDTYGELFGKLIGVDVPVGY